MGSTDALGTPLSDHQIYTIPNSHSPVPQHHQHLPSPLGGHPFPKEGRQWESLGVDVVEVGPERQLVIRASKLVQVYWGWVDGDIFREHIGLRGERSPTGTPGSPGGPRSPGSPVGP